MASNLPPGCTVTDIEIAAGALVQCDNCGCMFEPDDDEDNFIGWHDIYGDCCQCGKCRRQCFSLATRTPPSKANAKLIIKREGSRMAKHHEDHPDYGAMGIFAGYGECDEYNCPHIGIVSISETECQCMDCLRVWPKDPGFKSDWPEYDRG